MSSRSNNSPKPPASSGPESAVGAGGSGGTLSNDALYAPLSTYADVTSSSSSSAKNNNSTRKKSAQQQQQQHSLSIQTSSSLRESSLITFLSSMSQSLKTSHLLEYALYRGMGGSIAKFGMGDTDRGSNAMRGQFESKLLNRSLILVGGGVHKVSSTTKDTTDTSGVKNDNMSIVSGMGIASRAAATSSVKRERGRVGGNGIFGSISNKKRKKLLKQISVEKKKQVQQQPKEKNEECQLTIHHDGDVEQIIDKSLQKDMEQSKSDAKLNACNDIQHNATHAELQQKVGSVIETLHKMWLSYIQQLLTFIPTSSSDSSATLLSLDDCKHISHILATAEHVGMPASIVECPSRRHLVNVRCIIIDETKETYKIAMIKSKRSKQHPIKKKEGDAKQNDGSEVDSSKKDTKIEKVVASHTSHTWIIVLVPKRGTVLEIVLPWVNDSERTSITVRLET